MGAIIPPKLPFANLAKEVACYFVSPLPTLGKAYQTIIFPIEYPQIKDLTQCESKQYLYSKRKATLYSWDTGQTMKLPTIQTIRLGNLRPDLACYLEICFITLTRMLRLRMRHTAEKTKLKIQSNMILLLVLTAATTRWQRHRIETRRTSLKV